jgi:hypothetical protein
MLIWYKELWLIDFGASLYFHHSWNNWKEQAAKPFLLVKDHVLLPFASELEKVNNELKAIFSKELIRHIISLIPDEWLENEQEFKSNEEHRDAYLEFLETRIAHSEIFVKEAKHAREAII